MVFHKAGKTAFSSTGVATAHVTAHIAVHFVISQAVASAHLLNIGSVPHINHQITAHCQVLHNIVGATLVGDTANISQAHNIHFQTLAQVLSSKYLLVACTSLTCCHISVFHIVTKSITFQTCSVAIHKAPTGALYTCLHIFLIGFSFFHSSCCFFLCAFTTSTAVWLSIH